MVEWTFFSLSSKYSTFTLVPLYYDECFQLKTGCDFIWSLIWQYKVTVPSSSRTAWHLVFTVLQVYVQMAKQGSQTQISTPNHYYRNAQVCYVFYIHKGKQSLCPKELTVKKKSVCYTAALTLVVSSRCGL